MGNFAENLDLGNHVRPPRSDVTSDLHPLPKSDEINNSRGWASSKSMPKKKKSDIRRHK